ncbi:MAG: hypothetical protein ACLQVJ_19080 [Syntrophobacteraceae bacterium]
MELAGLGIFSGGEWAVQMKMQPLIDSKGKNTVFWPQKKNIDNVGKV